MRRRLVLIPLLVLVVVGGGGCWWWQSSSAASAAANAPIFATVTTATVQRAVTASGTVAANLDVAIKCKASGIVSRVPFDISEPVKKGDLVLELDPIDEQRSVNQATITLESSQANLEQARSNLAIAEADLVTTTKKAKASLAIAEVQAQDKRSKATRMAELLAQRLVSQEDADTAATTARQADADLTTAAIAVEALKSQELGVDVKRQAVRLAEATVASNRIALDNAKQRLIETKVLSPIDGVISALSVQIGSAVASGTSGISGGSSVMTISNLDRIFVLASVDESNIGQVQLGQQVEVTADAHPGHLFRGSVVRIATTGVSTSNVVTFEVKIEITGDDKALLKPLMTTNVTIVIERHENVVAVATEGLVRRKGHWFALAVKDAGGVEEREVKIGLTDGTMTEIASGLQDGERVQIQRNEAASKWRKNQQQGSHPPPMMMR
jgi:HlyD family secretion protein